MNESRTRFSTRVISMLLVACMVLGMVPASALPVFAAEQTVTQQNVEILLEYAEGLLESDFSKTTSTSSKYSWDTGEGKDYTWLYYNGIMLDSFIMNGTSASLELDALDFVASFYNANIRGTGRDDAYIARFGESNIYEKDNATGDGLLLRGELDSIAPARAMFDLLGTTKDQDKYEGAIQVMYSALTNGTDFKEVDGTGGNFYHKTNNSDWSSYPVAMDGIYMAQPFFMECAQAIREGNLTLYKADGETKVTAAEIEKAVYDRMMWVADNMDFTSSDGATLYHHGVNASGNGKADVVWLRGAGWYAAALVDVIEMMDDSTYKTNLIANLKIFLDGMLVYQDKTDGVVDSGKNTGMWYNVVYPAYSNSKNKLETSGTALMAYALMKAYNSGWMGAVTSDTAKAYGQAGLNAFNGIMSTNYSDGMVQNVYITAGVESSEADYCTAGYAAGEGKGMGPLLMATSMALDVESKLAGGTGTTEVFTAGDVVSDTLTTTVGNTDVDYSSVIATAIGNKGTVINDLTAKDLTFSAVKASAQGTETVEVSYQGNVIGTLSVVVTDPSLTAGDWIAVEWQTPAGNGDTYQSVATMASGSDYLILKADSISSTKSVYTLTANGKTGTTRTEYSYTKVSDGVYSVATTPATFWRIDDDGHIYCVIDGENYYIQQAKQSKNGESIVLAADAENAAVWQFSGDADEVVAAHTAVDNTTTCIRSDITAMKTSGGSVRILKRIPAGQGEQTPTKWAQLIRKNYTITAGDTLTVADIQAQCAIYTGTSAAGANAQLLAWDAEGVEVEWDTDLDVNTPGTYTMTVSVNEQVLGTIEVEVEPATTDPYITVSPSSLALVVGGESKTLTATIHNDNDCSVTWYAADNDATVRVEGGVCAPVAAGETTVYAQLWDSEGALLQTVEIPVTVTEPVVEFTLNKNSLALYSGDSAELTLAGVTIDGESVSTDGYTIGLTSDNAAVTVSGTTVTGAASGSATVTVQLYKDGNAVSGVTKEVTVTVGAVPTITITNASATQATEVQEGKTLNLATSINAAGSYTLSWQSSDSSIASVDQNGVVTGVKAGGPVTITVTLTTNARATVQATALITVTEALDEEQTATGNVTTSTSTTSNNNAGSYEDKGWVEINAGGGGGTTYQLVKEFAGAGDYVIVYKASADAATGVALKNNNQNGRGTGLPVSIKGDYVVFDEADADEISLSLWTVTASENGFTVHNGDYYFRDNNDILNNNEKNIATVTFDDVENSDAWNIRISGNRCVTYNASDNNFTRTSNSNGPGNIYLYKVTPGGEGTGEAEYAKMDGQNYTITAGEYASNAAMLEKIQADCDLWTSTTGSEDDAEPLSWGDVSYAWSENADVTKSGIYTLTVTYNGRTLGEIKVAVNSTTTTTTHYNATLTVTPGELKMNVGDAAITLEDAVTAVLAADNTTPASVDSFKVSWVSSNTDAVEVDPDNGEVTAVAAGNAVITATLTDVTIDRKVGSINGTISVDIPVTVAAKDDHTHSYTSEVTTPATCTTAGVMTYTCECGHSYTETIAALGHTDAEAVEENRREATCTEAGSYDVVVYCSVCDAEISRQTETIPATGHTEAEAVEENRKEATCTEAGSYDLVVYCSVCDAEISRQTKTIPATGHNYVDGECTVCHKPQPTGDISIVPGAASGDTFVIATTMDASKQYVLGNNQNYDRGAYYNDGWKPSQDRLSESNGIYTLTDGSAVTLWSWEPVEGETNTGYFYFTDGDDTYYLNATEADNATVGSKDSVFTVDFEAGTVMSDDNIYLKVEGTSGVRGYVYDEDSNQTIFMQLYTPQQESGSGEEEYYNVTLDAEDKTLEVGQTGVSASTTLSVVGAENGTAYTGTVSHTVTYSATGGDTGKISISSDGTITATGAGTITVTATLETVTLGGTEAEIISKDETVTFTVTVNAPTVSIETDETMALTTGFTGTIDKTYTPNSNNAVVTWAVTEGDAVSVDANGKVTALKAGTATITATVTVSYEGIDETWTASDTTTVTVTDPTVTLTADDLTINSGKSGNLTATATVDGATVVIKEIQWTTDSDALTIEGSTVTGTNEGTAPITATVTAKVTKVTVNGVEMACDLTADATVTVKPAGSLPTEGWITVGGSNGSAYKLVNTLEENTPYLFTKSNGFATTEQRYSVSGGGKVVGEVYTLTSEQAFFHFYWEENTETEATNDGYIYYLNADGERVYFSFTGVKNQTDFAYGTDKTLFVVQTASDGALNISADITVDETTTTRYLSSEKSKGLANTSSAAAMYIYQQMSAEEAYLDGNTAYTLDIADYNTKAAIESMIQAGNTVYIAKDGDYANAEAQDWKDLTLVWDETFDADDADAVYTISVKYGTTVVGTITVTMTGTPAPVVSFDVAEKDGVSLNLNGEKDLTPAITVTVGGTNAEYTDAVISWATADGEKVTVTDGTVKGIANTGTGTVNVTATLESIKVGEETLTLGGSAYTVTIPVKVVEPVSYTLVNNTVNVGVGATITEATFADVKVLITYSDGTTQEVSTGLSFNETEYSAIDTSKGGTTEVTAYYNGTDIFAEKVTVVVTASDGYIETQGDVTYKIVNTVTDGEEYLIVAADGSNFVALKNDSATSSSSAVPIALGVNVDGEEANRTITISSADAKLSGWTFTYKGTDDYDSVDYKGYFIQNNLHYIKNNSGGKILAKDGTNIYIMEKGNGEFTLFRNFANSGACDFYYDTSNDTWFYTEDRATSFHTVYLYEKVEGESSKVTKQIVFDAEVDKLQIPVDGTAQGSTTVLLDGVQLGTSGYEVTWADDGNDIVSVAADGTITGEKAGVATVTVTLSKVSGETPTEASSGSLTRTFTIEVVEQKVSYKLAGHPIYVRLNGEVSFEGITLEKTSVYVDADGNEIEGTAIVETISNSHLEFDPALADLDTSVPDADPNTAGIQPYQVPVYYNGVTLDEKVLVYVSTSPYYGLESTTNYPVFPEAGAVRLEKDATTVPGMDFQQTGVAKVELSVAGISNKNNIDVIMIVDVSNSMAWATGTETYAATNKLAESMTIAQDFADILLGATNNQNTLSFVTFAATDSDHNDGANAKDLDSTTSIFVGLGADKLDLIKESFAKTVFTSADGLTLGTLNSDKTEVVVTEGTNRGGTNYDYGFGQAMLALEDIWKQYGGKEAYKASGREAHVIFMSDGAPSYYDGNSFEAKDHDYVWGTKTSYKKQSGDWTTHIQKPNQFATSLYAEVDGFYAVGFDLANGGFTDYMPGTSDEAKATWLANLKEVLEGLVKNERLQVELANDTDELRAFYTELAEALVMAGTDAKADDTIGKEFTLFTGTQGDEDSKACPSDITVGTYDLYSRAEFEDENGQITDEEAKLVGTHRLDDNGKEKFTPLIKVSFENGLPVFWLWNAETSAYVAPGEDDYKNSYTVDASGKVTMIDTEYFTYTIDASGTEKIEWHIGNITDDEIVINYYVYLTGSHDNPQWRESGVYVTNEVASIEYVDINGAYSVRTFERPSMAWGEASITFRFYLVNKDGRYVNWAGDVFDAKANRLFLQNQAMESIEQGEEGIYTMADIYAMSGLSDIYQLYCSGDTEIAIRNSFSENAEAGVDYYGKVTYAEGDLAEARNLVEIESINGDKFVQAVVEIPILVPEHGAETSGRPMVADEVVLDYYQSVVVDVLTIERERVEAGSAFGKFDLSVVGFHAYYEGHNEKWIINPDDITRNTRLVTDYGIFELIETGDQAGKVKFTPAKELTSPVRVFCEVFTEQTVDANGNKVEAGSYDNYLYNQLTIYPASNVYYEAESFPGISYVGGWTKDEADAIIQDDSLVGNGNVYGYDSHYTHFAQDSANGSLFVNGQGVDTATNKFKTYARFAFTGSGLDIIGRTGPEQGMIRVTVYTDEAMTNAYKTVTVLNKGETELHQIPVVELRDLSVDTYYVEIGVYNAWKPAGSALAALSRGGEFYLDAIRIYDPVGADGERALAEAAYYADGEANPIYMDIRDTLIGAGNFDASSDSAVTEGALYLDTDRSESGKYTVDEYKNLGPNNEVYLLPGNAIAFKVQLQDANVPASLDIGAKTIAAGHTPDLKVTVRSASGVISAYTVSDIATATDMYYPVAAPGTAISSLFTSTDNSPYGEAIIVIQNADTTGSDVLSITDLKLAYGNAAVSEAAEAMIISDMDTVITASKMLNGIGPDYDIRAVAFDESEATVLDLTTMTVVTSSDVRSLVITDGEGSQVWSSAIYLETISGERIWTVTVRPVLLGEQRFTVTGYGADGTAGEATSASIYVGY